MAGALSLQEDILALVKKHGDTCLPEDLLARLAEEARLLAVREQIRALHEADRFGLFSEPSAEQESDGDEEDDGAEDAKQDGGGGGGAGQDKEGQTLVLPDNVKRMLSSMKVTRLDKVAALNGFTTIDAEVEFSLNNAATTSTASPSPPPGKAASSQPATEVAEGAPSPPSEPPVYLLFRFRRESLPKSPDSSSSDSGSDSDSGEDSDADDVFITGVAGPRKTSSVTVVNLSDEEEEDKVGGSRKSAVVVGKKDRRKGSGSCSSGNSSSRDGGMTGKAGGGGAPEGRKRASSGNGGDTRRKRPKGGGEEDGEEEAEEEAPERGENKGCMEEVCQTGQTGCCGDGSETDGVGLAFDPRTLVSYTICGGVGYDQPNVLLQAVVYARGDGPACVMPSPVGVASHEGDEEAMSASDTSDQDDVFDCNVDGPALAAVGRALGLHTADSEDDGQDQHEGRSSLESEGLGGKSAKHDGGMTVSDLVWWVMLFPFFEKEFDMVEVVASSVFGEDGSDSDDGEGKDDNESSDDGEPGA